MFSIAYRMVGSVSEAEELVQEAFLRIHVAAPDDVKSPEAYATTVTTRLSIDHLRSARVRREEYVGPWLPEPLRTDTAEDPALRAEVDETLSMAFLVLLENLSPTERAVFLLREVFDYDYGRIAAIVDKTEPNCRQILLRARQRLEDRQPRFEASRQRRQQLAERFFAACESGDLDALEQLLADDVAFHADGGGKVAALAEPALGRVRVARFLLGIFRQVPALNGRVELAEVNGQPGARLVHPDGRTGAVMTLDVVDGHISVVRNIINPDKLAHLAASGPTREESTTAHPDPRHVDSHGVRFGRKRG